MTALTRQRGRPEAADWHADVVQLLDEHHLVAVSPSVPRQVRFASSLAGFLHALRDAEVCPIHGRTVRDLDSFCAQLERLIAGPMLERRIDGPCGVTSLLRHRETWPGRPAAKFRFYLWSDADVLLGHDEHLFGRLVDALAGVAAEAEYSSDDLLFIQRAVFIGGAELRRYWECADGQFRAWYNDGAGRPFWNVVTGLGGPPIQPLSLDALFDPLAPKLRLSPSA